MKKLFQPTNYIDSWYLMRNALNFYVENKYLNLVTILQVSLAAIFMVLSFLLLESTIPSLLKMLGVFGGYLVLTLAFTYINAIITTILLKRLQNLPASLSESVKKANQIWFQLTRWSLLANTLGVLAKFFEGPAYAFEQLTRLRVNFNWTNSAYFSLPILVSEKRNLRAMMLRSQDIVGRGFRSTVSIKALVTIFYIFFLMILNEFALNYPAETTQALLYISPVFLISYVIASCLELILICALFLSIAKQKDSKHFDKTLLDRVFVKEPT